MSALRRAALGLPIIMMLSVPSGEGLRAQGLGWQTYQDATLGFQIEYPAAIFVNTTYDETGGVTLSTADGRARLQITGGPNALNLTPSEAADELARSPDVREVTYRRIGNSWIVLSGYLRERPGGNEGDIFYARIEFSPDRRAISGFRMEYPPSYRYLIDSLIGPIGRSLTAPRPAYVY